MIVSPFRNVGVPGGIQSAIDYFYSEIKGKSCLIIGYGIMGGGLAVYALQMGSMKGISAHIVETRPMVLFGQDDPLKSGMP